MISVPGFIESEWSRYHFNPERLLKMQSGADIINNFLRLVLNQGLLNSELLSRENLTELSTRLVDTQIPSAARKVRSFIDQPLTPEQLPRFRFELRFLGNLARLLLKFDECSLPLKLEIWQLCGGTISKDLVMKQQGLRDDWIVKNISVTREDSLTTRKIWLKGLQSGQWIFTLDYSFGNQKLPGTHTKGSILGAAAHFYPGLLPGRVQLSELPLMKVPAENQNHSFPDIATMKKWIAGAAGLNPFFQERPVSLQDVVIAVHDERFYAVDRKNEMIPIATREADSPDGREKTAWRIYAEAGGKPVFLSLMYSKGSFYFL